MIPVLTVDVGGSNVKVLLSGESERRRVGSGPRMSAAEMVPAVLELAEGWEWEAVSIGVPAPVRDGRVAADPVNLGDGWAGFDFESAFGKPTRVVNDAAMQALGSYEGGKMLFLGLGTGPARRSPSTGASRRWSSATSRTATGRSRRTSGREGCSRAV